MSGTYYPFYNMTDFFTPSWDALAPHVSPPPSFVAPVNFTGNDLTFGNYTYQVPKSYPHVESWSPDMMAMINYNKDNLETADSALFMHFVSEVDATALYRVVLLECRILG